MEWITTDGTCTTGKRRFGSQGLAQQVLQGWAELSCTKPTAVYACKHCCGWHLTSKEQHPPRKPRKKVGAWR